MYLDKVSVVWGTIAYNDYCTTISNKAASGLAYAATSYKVPFGATFTPEISKADGVSGISYESDNTSVASVNTTTGEVTAGTTAGTATITATFDGDANFEAGTATYTVTTYDPNANDGSEAKPYTVTEALALIETLGTATSTSVYVKGIVSTAPAEISSKKATYFISANGEASNELKIYAGKNIGNTDFSAITDLSAGDEVTIFGTLKKYNSTPQFNDGNYITKLKHDSEPEVKSISVSADQYKTYVPTENLVVPTGVKAYIATGESSTTLTLTSVPKIKAGTPVILNAEKANYSFEVTNDEVTYSKTNLLQISDGTVTSGVFVLAKIDGNINFYKWMGGALSAGKVYVPAPAAASRDFLDFVFDNETTAIESVVKTQKVDGQYFNLAGQRVAQPTKGLYIVNGKKVVIK